MLFFDQPSLIRSSIQGDLIYPWTVLFAKEEDEQGLKKIAEDFSLDSRIRLLAYNQLRHFGHTNEKEELLGVVIEVGLDQGLDVVAAYRDGTARYINHAEKMIIWETPTAHSEELIRELFAKCEEVVKNIGPWDQDRLPHPGNGMIRMTFLVSNGIYFGQGPFEALQKDAMGGPVISAATNLMVFLVEKDLLAKGEKV